MTARSTFQAVTAAFLVAGMLAGCGTHLSPAASTAAAAALAAQSKKKTTTRKAPPAIKTPSAATRQGFAANQASQSCATALATYQNLTYQWSSAYSDADKDNVETEMLQVLHQGLQNVQSITSANGVDATDRRSYDIADQGLNQYDSEYANWTNTWDVTQKRFIANQMMTDMVNCLQQVEANY